MVEQVTYGGEPYDSILAALDEREAPTYELTTTYDHIYQKQQMDGYRYPAGQHEITALAEQYEEYREQPFTVTLRTVDGDTVETRLEEVNDADPRFMRSPYGCFQLVDEDTDTAIALRVHRDLTGSDRFADGRTPVPGQYLDGAAPAWHEPPTDRSYWLPPDEWLLGREALNDALPPEYRVFGESDARLVDVSHDSDYGPSDRDTAWFDAYHPHITDIDWDDGYLRYWGTYVGVLDALGITRSDRGFDELTVDDRGRIYEVDGEHWRLSRNGANRYWTVDHHLQRRSNHDNLALERDAWSVLPDAADRPLPRFAEELVDAAYRETVTDIAARDDVSWTTVLDALDPFDPDALPEERTIDGIRF